MKRGLIVFTLVLVVLTGCSDVREFPVDSYQPSSFRPQEDPVRPQINRTPVEQYEEPEEEKKQPVPRKRVPELSTPVEEHRLSVGYGVVGLNRSIGKYAPVYTKYEFPELLKSRNIRSRLDPISASYEQFLKPLGGRVVISADEEGNPGDYLFYEEDEPLFEYTFELSKATFLDFIESEIEMLGHKYEIVDATKEDVTLKHVESGSELVIGERQVMLDGENLGGTTSDFDGKSFTVISKAEFGNDDIYIPFNHSLQQYLDEPTLLTDKLDIRYMGIPEVPSVTYDFNNKGDELELHIETPFRQSVIPLAFDTGNGLRLGDEEGMLHVREGSDKSDFVVSEEDYVLLTDSRVSESNLFFRHKQDNRNRISMVFQYKGHDPDDRSIEFGSREGIAMRAYYNGTPGDDAEGFVDFAGKRFKFAVGSDGKLAMDLNGDERISGSIVDYMTVDGTVDLPSKKEFERANLTLKFLNYGDQGMKKEQITLEVTEGFDLEPFTELEIVDIRGDTEAAFSTFGTEYYFINEEGSGYEEVRIKHPLVQRIAEIVIEAR